VQSTVTFGRRGVSPPPTASAKAPQPKSSPRFAPAPAAGRASRPERPPNPDFSLQQISAMLFSAQGRMSRRHYCVQSLISAVVYLVGMGTARLTLPPLAASLIVLFLSTAFIWSAAATRVKRWHDRDKSGWWCWIMLLPIIGWVWAVVECRYLSGTRGPNRFGEDPRVQAQLSEIFA